MARTYEEIIKDYKSRYGISDDMITDWQKTLCVVGGKPLEAFRHFESKDDLATFLKGYHDASDSSTHYDIYDGALVTVGSGKESTLYRIMDSCVNDYDVVGVYDDINRPLISFTDVDKDASVSGRIFFTGTRGYDESRIYYTRSVYYDKDGTLYSDKNMQSSDLRLKENITKLDVDLDKIGEIDKVCFTWKDKDSGDVQIGTTAQSVQEVFPELVHTNSDTGYMSVNYDGLSVVALAAIDKLYAKIRDLEAEIVELKKGKEEK